MRKLRIMEKSQAIWTMECQILIDPKCLVIYDKKTNQEVEIFPIELVCDPTSVVSEDKKDNFNNILLFTVLEDYKKKADGIATPTEMHLFQSVRTHSAQIVDEIYKIKENRIENVIIPQHQLPLHHPTQIDINKNNQRSQRYCYPDYTFNTSSIEQSGNG